MITHCETHISPSSKLSCSPTVTAFDASFNQCVKNYKELLSEYDRVLTDLESCRNALSKQNDMCERKTCSAAESLQKVISAKEAIIQAAASELIILNESRDWSYISRIFSLLYGETTTSPPKHISNTTIQLEAISSVNSNLQTKTPNKKIKIEKLSPIKQTLTPKKKCPKHGLKLIIQGMNSPKREQISRDLSSSLEDVSFKDESMSDIDVTPRAKSPVLENKKRKNMAVYATNLSNSDSCDGGKRKGVEAWARPAKQPKLQTMTTPCSSKQKTSTPSGKKKTKQTRFSAIFLKNVDVVDLTSSPEFSGGTRGDNKGPIKSLIKAESCENEETILPSPTSNPTHELTMFKSSKDKDSQSKFKRPLSLKHKSDATVDHKDETVDDKNNLKDQTNDMKVNLEAQKDLEDLESGGNDLESDPIQCSLVVSYASTKKRESKCGDLETSLNILNPNPKRFRSPKKSPPKPVPMPTDVDPNIDYDVTHCDSFSNIEEVKENCSQDNKLMAVTGVKSPSKQPLGENTTVCNILQEADSSSMSLLTKSAGDGMRKSPERVEPVYKEPTVRKKAEKMALPAWLCDQCKQFTEALYDDGDGEKCKAVIQACGKHRGRQNPVRPKTPTGFWEVRWNVPEDTEEFNRRNNAA